MAGRIAEAKGRKGYVLERGWLGRQHTFTLQVQTLRQAEGQLAPWDTDPAALLRSWRQQRAGNLAASQAEVRLTDELLADLEADMRARKTSAKHLRDTLAYCRQWQEDLGRMTDIRQLTRQHVQRALASHTIARAHRVIALKTLGDYMVEAGLIEHSHNPGRHAVVPPNHPARAVAPRGYSAETLERAYRAIVRQPHRDVFRLQACYGLHGWEVQRLARGDWHLQELSGHGAIAGTVTFQHKSGAPHTISIDRPALAAAKRLLAGWQMLDALRASCRGSRGTRSSSSGSGRKVYPAGRGVSIEDIADTEPLESFYDGGVPWMLVLPVSLLHPDEPA